MIRAQQFNRWLDQHVYHPDLTPQFLLKKKLVWIWTASAGFAVFLMTIFAYLMRVPILVRYGIVLLVIYAIMVPLIAKIKDHERLVNVSLSAVIFITFLTILQLGGIVHAMGLIFVGLACASASVLQGNIRWTFFTFAFYSLTILAAGLLQPYLEVPPENTPAKNLVFYVINTLWISGTTLNFTVDYIKQRSHFEAERAENLRALDEAKTKLYTNITHEFRTPLTIILGMTEQLSTRTGQALSRELQLIRRSGENLLHLVNQMLDLQKIEAAAMPIHPVQGNIIPFLAYVVHSFSSLAALKQIQLQFEPENSRVVMDYDPEKYQDILANLVSNAIKFTPEQGRILVTTRLYPKATSPHQRSELILTVMDNGIGIPPAQLPHIFDRFYQVNDGQLHKPRGTGIGLALTKELVKLLGAKIEVRSEEGTGTTFVIRFPVSNTAKFQETTVSVKADNESLTAGSLLPPSTPNLNADQPIALVVDDNEDMMAYITMCLQDQYQLDLAHNGKEALEKALEHIPDVIISDVMMPEMDGFALCRQLKTDFRTSHIPVILLTARADQASRIAGLATGADAYLIKPFHKGELLLRIQKLIELRKELQRRYTSPEAASTLSIPTLPLEDEFMQKVRDTVASNLSDEDFDIEKLCQSLAMSRSQLYRKFEALTDMPIGKYIRTQRLYKAKELLEKGQVNVTEAAMQSGFRNLSHFSTAFKEEFGISPKEVSN
jgi:signal transduction histidine kinase/DNA-binding response OmpR family regulator